MTNDTDDRTIRELLAEGRCCSQIMLILALRLKGETNESMVQAASGLCVGMHSGLLCGSLTGAAMALALFDPGNAKTRMIPQLMEWYDEGFGERYNGSNCLAITGGSKQPERCREIITETWREVKRLLAEYGFAV